MNTKPSRILVRAPAIVLGLLLSACGGGGGTPAPVNPPAPPAPSGLSYPNPQVLTVGVALAAISPTIAGTVTSYAAAPALPAGLTLNASSGVISGTPTMAMPQATHTITASNAGGSTSFSLTLTVNAAPAASFNVGFQVLTYAPGRKAAIWMPTTGVPSQGSYPSGLTSEFVPNGWPPSGQVFPLVVFSHGDGGCGTQSLVLAEQLARNGFIVAAPDHADALCSVDGGSSRGPDLSQQPAFADSQLWSDATYTGRREDVRALTDYLLAMEPYRSSIDSAKIAMAGHSLGGYTALGMVGAWSTWRDSRFKAALLLSPYLLPYLDYNTLPAVTVPVMFQGGTADAGITPFIKGPAGAYGTGAYTLANRSKYFLELRGAGHFAWTNSVCTTPGSVEQCRQSVTFNVAMSQYAVAFFRRHLQGNDQPLLRTQDPVFATYLFDE